MPFGAELEGAGGVRFRLWAPAAARVDVVLCEGTRRRVLPMTALGEGWFERSSREAHAGTRYGFAIDAEGLVPDPASRYNPDGAESLSEVVDPQAFEWDDDTWHPPAWHEAVVYELHVGTFSPEGRFAGVEARLDHLVRLGVNIIELMPLADFAGARGWGYDGVLPFAPHASYGTPDELKHLVAAAHRAGLAVMLDVVYNHLGPQGNQLPAYAPQLFTARHATPWGPAINFDGPDSRTVRDFFIHNALYWLTEYHLDGLRLDAVQAIRDTSEPHILAEIAEAVRRGPGHNRPVHLVLENGDNEARWLGAPGGPGPFEAQWNDDVHRSLHVLLTGETCGYFADYARSPAAHLCRGLAEGFSYQGEVSAYYGAPRGSPSGHLPPTAFLNFLQNHDQVGNRLRGERLGALVAREDARLAAAAIVLLSPSPPMLFMGEEWEASTPFLYFCDLEPGLAARVRAGRCRELAHFAGVSAAQAQALMPDPGAAATFERSRLDWSELDRPHHAGALEQHRRLLAIRRRDIIPLVPEITGSSYRLAASGAFAVEWSLAGKAGSLHLIANPTAHPAPLPGPAGGRLIFATHPDIRGTLGRNELAPWSVLWLFKRGVP